MRKRTALGMVAAAVVLLFGVARSTTPRSVSAAPARAIAPRSRPVAPVSTKASRVDRPERARAQQLLFASWGGAEDQLGRERLSEGSPVGPMSFAADSRGRILVLDGVNARLVRRDAQGRVEKVTALDGNPEDVAVGPDGSAAVLDRYREKSVTIYDASGKIRGKLPLEGEGVPDTGSVTGVFVDQGEVWVEREHASLVKIGSLGAEPARTRSEIPGRPSRDGLSFLNAGMIETSAGRVYVSSIARATSEHRFTRELRLEAPARSIVLLDSDLGGTIYFAVIVSGSETSESTLLFCLDPESGAPVGTAVLPVNTLPEESFRDLVVLDGGGVVQALRTESGVSYTRYDCE